jgi:hypothetical protein
MRSSRTFPQEAVAIRVCFHSRVKNADVVVGTSDAAKARRIARLWGERTEGEPVTRTISKGAATTPSTPHELIEDVRIWAPLF